MDLLQSVKFNRVTAWTAGASNLCAAGKRSEIGPLMVRAIAALNPQNAEEVAMVGLAFSKCGNKKSAREFFIQAQTAGDKTPACSGDMCWNFTAQAQQAVSNKIIEGGEIDLLDSWPPKGVLSASSEIHAGLKKAQNGDPHGGLRRLEQIEKSVAPERAIALRREFALARAEILSQLKRDREANDQFSEAVRGAAALQDTNSRALALIAISYALERVRSCERALPLLRQARVNLDVTRMSSSPPIFKDNAQAITIFVAQGLARCGFTAEASGIASAILADASAAEGRRFLSRLLAEQIVAQVAVIRAQRREADGALKELEAISPSVAKLRSAMEINSLHDGSRQSIYFLNKQVELVGAYFLAAQNDLERRILIGQFAQLLRDSANWTKEAKSNLFKTLLDESDRIASINWKARALCELGYTAIVLGRDDGRRILDIALQVAKSHGARTFPLDPPPAGACSYWLKKAGDDSGSKTAADQPIEPLRASLQKSNDVIRWANAGTLLGLVVSYAEAQHGELLVEWQRLVWD